MKLCLKKSERSSLTLEMNQLLVSHSLNRKKLINQLLIMNSWMLVKPLLMKPIKELLITLLLLNNASKILLILKLSEPKEKLTLLLPKMTLQLNSTDGMLLKQPLLNSSKNFIMKWPLLMKSQTSYPECRYLKKHSKDSTNDHDLQ